MIQVSPVRSKADMFPGKAAAEKTVSATSDLQGEIRPLDLASYTGPLYVKNLTKSKISHDDSKGNEMTLGPSYSDDAMAVLPLEIARHPGFQKMWRQGKFLVSADPEMEEALRLAEINSDARDKRMMEARQSEVQMQQDPGKKDLSANKCLKCDEIVFTAKGSDAPPLCGLHEDLASMFTAEVYIDNNDDNKPKTRWVEAKIG